MIQTPIKQQTQQFFTVHSIRAFSAEAEAYPGFLPHIIPFYTYISLY